MCSFSFFIFVFICVVFMKRLLVSSSDEELPQGASSSSGAGMPAAKAVRGGLKSGLAADDDDLPSRPPPTPLNDSLIRMWAEGELSSVQIQALVD
jgi:hypothetical protein